MRMTDSIARSQMLSQPAPDLGPEPLWLLANPAAGRGRARRLKPALEAFFRANGACVKFLWPDSAEELRFLAAQMAAAGCRRLAVVGGDGTFLDVVNEIHGREIEIGLLPAGDANDVAVALGLPRDPLRAAELWLTGNARPIDLVQARLSDGRRRVYVGAGGAGLDAEAARLAAGSFHRLPRIWRYVAGALAAFPKFEEFELDARFDEETFHGPAFLVAVANAPAYGGGIQIAPAARLDDGWLDIAIIPDLTWPRILFALPALIGSGRLHGLHRLRFRARRIWLNTTRPVAFHGDGEDFGKTPLELELLPGALRVVAPAKPGG